jgi:imidazolonepropionase-like amidohydrolase
MSARSAAFLLTLVPLLARAEGKPDVAVPPLPREVPKSATLYSVLLAGNPAGHQATWRGKDGKLHAFFEFNDRGRGPRIRSELVLGKDGIPSSEQNRGVDYLKGEVDERFSVSAGQARWKNKAETGSKPAAGAFYVSMYGSPEAFAVLSRALLHAGGKLPLLPEGEARIERVADLAVEAGGKAQTVTQYSISGLGFSPFHIWLDADRNLFASGGSWTMVIRKGWEPVAKAIIDAQQAGDDRRAAELARRLPQRSAELVLYNANVFDAETATVKQGQTVVVAGERIRSVAPAKPADRQAANAIDATGKTLLPGLWDMHAHVSDDDDGLLNLAAGVTTVRDLANDTDELERRRARIDGGTEIGTRIVAAGFMDGPGPFQGPTKVLVDDEAEVRAALQRYAKLGYPQVKLYSSLERKLVSFAIDEAHKLGMRVSGHIPAGMTAAECVKLGFDEIQHVNFLTLNFMPDVVETRTPARFIEPGKRAADLDLESAEVRGFIQLVKDEGVAIDPTLTVFENLYLDRPGVVPEGFAAVFARLPVQVRRGFLVGGLPVTAETDERHKRSFAKMVKLVGAMHRAGVTVLAGTDGMAGFTLHRELELHVQAGIPAAQVLRSATLGAARLMKRDRELGSIAAGKLADLVLVNGDPAARISDIRRVELTVKGGALYRSEDLYRELGIKAP